MPPGAQALEAAEQRQREDGLSVEVIELRTLLRWYAGDVRPVRKTNRRSAPEDNGTGGIAGRLPRG